MSFFTKNPSPMLQATPQESYPRYSKFFNPSTTNAPASFLVPTYPNIPHIDAIFLRKTDPQSMEPYGRNQRKQRRIRKQTVRHHLFLLFPLPPLFPPIDAFSAPTYHLPALLCQLLSPPSNAHARTRRGVHDASRSRHA